MRHAQLYWLQLQARLAVAKAMDPQAQEVERHELDEYNGRVGMLDDRQLQVAHDVAISRAAGLLETAELLHREKCRRGLK